MEYRDKHEETIVECAKKIRHIQETHIEPLMRTIQDELSVKFPSLNGKDSDGVADWSCDIQNCDSDDEVIKTLNRIDNIENDSWKCAFCGKDTFDVDIDYLFGFNHIECALKAEDLAGNKNHVENLKDDFDEVVKALKQLQDKIIALENKSTKF